MHLEGVHSVHGKLTRKWQERVVTNLRNPAHAPIGAAYLYKILPEKLKEPISFAVAIHHSDKGLLGDNIERPDVQAINDGIIKYTDNRVKWDERVKDLEDEYFPEEVKELNLTDLKEMARGLRLWSRGCSLLEQHARRMQMSLVHHILKLCDISAASEREEYRKKPDDPFGGWLMVEKIKKYTDNLQIRLIAEKIKEKFDPKRIILFGSYACGVPKKSSDLDLFVIMETNIPVRKQAFLIRRELKGTIPGRTASTLTLREGEDIPLDLYKDFPKVISENIKSELICRHRRREIKKVSNVIGLTSGTSYHHERDYINVQKDTYGIHRPTNPKEICKICALLALLGSWYATFMFSAKGSEVFAVPLPKKEIEGVTLSRIFSLQHVIRKEWVNKDIPQRTIPLVLFTKIPSSAEILEGFDLFISVISRQQGYHVDGLFLVPLGAFLHYITYSPYNVASIDNMLNRDAFDSLSALSNLIISKTLTETLKFSRSYATEKLGKSPVYFLFPETARYLLKEVAMIKPEIIKNEAISSVARTLRYFIRDKKYHYADDIRNARKDSKDFEETIGKMLREGRLRLEQKELIHLPNEDEIKELFQLANENFDEVKTTLAILAFSFPTKREEIEGEIKEEVQDA